GLFHWTGGAISGAGGLINNGAITVSGSTGTRNLNLTTLHNAGMLLLNASTSLTVGMGGSVSTLENEATGVIDFQGDASLLNSNGNGTLNNAGIVRKSAGTGPSSITVHFNNTPNGAPGSGVIDVQTGTIDLAGDSGVSTGGMFQVAASAVLDLVSGNLHTNTY